MDAVYSLSLGSLPQLAQLLLTVHVPRAELQHLLIRRHGSPASNAAASYSRLTPSLMVFCPRTPVATGKPINHRVGKSCAFTTGV